MFFTFVIDGHRLLAVAVQALKVAHNTCCRADDHKAVRILGNQLGQLADLAGIYDAQQDCLLPAGVEALSGDLCSGVVQLLNNGSA